MKLTPFQYRTLKIYRRYHTHGYTVSELLRASWYQWVVLTAFCLVAYFFARTSPELGWLGVGLFGGAMLRDVGYYRVGFRMWPIVRELYDWKRMSELIESHDKDMD
jgi:hypothetical protein